MAENWVDDVLAFWFEELEPKAWFSSSKELDHTISERFGALYERLSKQTSPRLDDDARSALAAVILFDQFPRNMYRGTARAYATDDLAMRIAREAVDKRLDEQLSTTERQFLYMPFQHSEVSADQEHAVMLFKTLGGEDSLRYAIEHRDIIQRFGRFPHRNRALGRISTREEEEFLDQHAGFGQ